MNELEQALAAVEAGDKKRAFPLLARLIKREPDHVAAWYTLSTLVDDEAKEETFLKKVVAIEPNHEAAQQRLAVLTGAAPATAEEPVPEMPMVEEPPAPVADEPAAAVPETDDESLAHAPVISTPETAADFEMQSAGDTVPEWLAEEEGGLFVAPDDRAAAATVGAETDTAEPLPDWLQTNDADAWTEEAAPAQEMAPAGTATSSQKPTGRRRSFWDLMLYGLIGVAVIMALLLLYLLIQSNFF